jgi:hypothetical protein
VLVSRIALMSPGLPISYSWLVSPAAPGAAQVEAVTGASMTGAAGDPPGISTDARGVFDDGRLKAAWVKDPDGNTFAITELLK